MYDMLPCTMRRCAGFCVACVGASAGYGGRAKVHVCAKDGCSGLFVWDGACCCFTRAAQHLSAGQ